MEPVLDSQTSALITDLRRRVFDLERRRNKDVNELRDLDDVLLDYDNGPDQPDDNDGLFWDATLKRWVAKPGGGGGGGAYASVKVHGEWSGGTFGAPVLEWLVSSGVADINVVTSGGTEFGGLSAVTPGIYEAVLNWNGTAIYGAALTGPQWQPTESGTDCFSQQAAYTGSADYAGTIVGRFALDPVHNSGGNGGTVAASFDGTSCDWTMELHWYAPLLAYTGDCGGG